VGSDEESSRSSPDATVRSLKTPWGRRTATSTELATAHRLTFRFRDLSAASAMAVRSLGPPTTMSFRLAIGH